MYENSDETVEPRKSRRVPSTRVKTPQAMRSTRARRKPSSNGSGFGGVHQRRNKHWSW